MVADEPTAEHGRVAEVDVEPSPTPISRCADKSVRGAEAERLLARRVVLDEDEPYVDAVAL